MKRTEAKTYLLKKHHDSKEHKPSVSVARGHLPLLKKRTSQLLKGLQRVQTGLFRRWALISVRLLIFFTEGCFNFPWPGNPAIIPGHPFCLQSLFPSWSAFKADSHLSRHCVSCVSLLPSDFPLNWLQQVNTLPQNGASLSPRRARRLSRSSLLVCSSRCRNVSSDLAAPRCRLIRFPLGCLSSFFPPLPGSASVWVSPSHWLPSLWLCASPLFATQTGSLPMCLHSARERAHGCAHAHTRVKSALAHTHHACAV